MRAAVAAVRRAAVAGYRWIEEPRHERIIWAMIYACIGISGALAVTVVPLAIQNVFGYWGTVALATLTAVGGIAGLIAVLPDVRPLERLGVGACGLAYVLYTLVLIGLSASPMAIGYTVSLALVMLLRLVQIRGPKRAKRLEPEEGPWTSN